MSTTIESLELELQASSQSAESSLDALSVSLEKLKKATSGGVGLTSVAKQIRSLGDAAKGISSVSVNNLGGLTNAIRILSNLGNLKLSSTVATQITAISDSAKGLTGVDFTTLSALASALQPLSTVGKVNLTSTINQLQKIPKITALFATTDTFGLKTKIQELVSALTPLSSIPKQTISSTLSQIKRMPEIFTGLQAVDMGAFTTKIQELVTALRPLADEMNKVAAGFSAFPAKIQKLLSSTNNLSNTNKKASFSYINLYAKLRMAYTAVKNIGDKIASAISKMNDYIENINLFNASMGKYASEAQQYAETVGDAMGIDPGEWMRNQGIFMTLATGFGVVGDRAYTMSTQLTQLGYDLSSFFNISFEDALLKLQSGLSGELEPLRRLGYDLSQAKLQAIALSLGIDKTYNSMTQAEKAQLRYYAIMTQVTTAQGDMARTLNAPANQLRIFKSQIVQAARAFGSIFIPMLNAVLPYLIAAAKVTRYLAGAIASLFGFKMPEVDYSGIGSVTGGAEDASDALDDAADSAKKLKSYLMGFDELNIIDPSADTSNALDEIGNMGNFDFELPKYDFLNGLIDSKVNKIVEEMKEWLGVTGEINSWADLFDTKLGKILMLVAEIGGAIALWKLSTGLITGMAKVKDTLDLVKATNLSKPMTITMGATLAITGITFEATGIMGAISDGLDGIDFAKIIGGGGMIAGGGALIGKGIAAAAGAALGAGIGSLVAGIPAMFVGIYDACVNGIDWLSGILIPAGGAAAGLGVAAILTAAGTAVSPGIGTLIGLAVGLLIDGVILLVQNWDAVSEFFTKFFTVTIPGIWDNFAKWTKPIPNKIKKWFDDILNSIRAFDWKGLGYEIGQWFGNALEDIGVFIKETLPRWSWEVGVAIREAFKTFFSETLPKFFGETIPALARDIISKIAAAVKEIGPKLADVGKAIVDGIVQGFQTIGQAIKSFVSGFVEGVKDALGIHSPSTVFAEIGVNLVKGLWQGIKNTWYVVTDFFSDRLDEIKRSCSKAWDDITSAAVTAFDDMKTKITRIWDDLWSGLKETINFIIGGVETMANGVIKGINGLIGALNRVSFDIPDWVPALGGKTFGLNIETLSTVSIPRLAAGGVVSNGQMFVAREAGAELVGNVGRKTAVMNNDQIVESVSKGVFKAVVSAMAATSTPPPTNNGEVNVKVYLDSKEITALVEKRQRERGVSVLGGVVYG